MNALLERAVQAHRNGHLETAVTLYEQMIARGAQSSELQFNLAMAEHGRGRLDSAIASMRRAVALSPGDTALHNNLGGMLLEHGELDAAAAIFTAALKADPTQRNVLFNLGSLEQRRGHLEAAARCFRAIIDHHGADPETINRLSNTMMDLGDAEGAIALLKTSCNQQPDPRNYNNLGLALRATGHPAEATGAYRQALAMAPGFAGAHNNLGNLLLEQGDSDAALTHLRRATELAPDSVHIHTNLGIAQQATGRFKDAEVSLQRANAIDPNFAAAKRHLSLIGGRGDLQSQVTECRALLKQTDLPEGERAHLHFALGKLLDELQEYDQAFTHYQRGNAQVRKGISFSAEAFTCSVDEVMDCFDEMLLARSPLTAHTSPRSVMVVGMPRSGTSLVEQVLASHPQISGAGELSFFSDLEGRLAELTGAGPYPGCARALNARQTQGIAEEYLAVLNACDGDSRYVIDKLPSNARRLGLIQLVLANARVIYCTRDARDLGLSNYFQYFTRHLDFAYDLYELGVATREHERIMEHWREHLSLPIIEIAYEHMVTDLEACTRTMLEFLDLPFDPRCLDFHRTQRTVRTASSWQVRQPLYASSAGRWQHYAGHLSPLLEGLAAPTR